MYWYGARNQEAPRSRERSGGITLPKEFLREFELVDDNDELADAHMIVEKDDENDGLVLSPIH